MILSTSKKHSSRALPGRILPAYLGVSAFCLVFFLIYDQFSHGVRSPYMTWLFLWPLMLGAVPCLLLALFPSVRGPGLLSRRLWRAGVAAATVSSLLRGILEIAGTDSQYQIWLMWAGVGMFLLGLLTAPLRGREGRTDEV